MVTAAEQERPIPVEQLESPWLSIREGQKAFTKLSVLAPTLPPDSPLNGRIQEFIDRESRTAMIRYAPPFERNNVDLRENDTAESLLEAIQRGQKAFVAMVEQWLPLVYKITRRIFNRLDIHNNPVLEFDDLAAAGVEGLMEAVANHARGIKFPARAFPNIRGRIFEELRQHAGVPRGSLSFLRQTREACDRFEATSGRTPTVEELCTATGLTKEQVKTGLFYRKLSVISLNKPLITDDGEENPTLEDFLQQEEQEGVPELAVKRWEHSLLATAISQLKPREQQVIILYYFNELTLGETGGKLGVVGSRASRLRSAAIQHLRAVLLPLDIRSYDPTVAFVGHRKYNVRRRQPPCEKDYAPTSERVIFKAEGG